MIIITSVGFWPFHFYISAMTIYISSYKSSTFSSGFCFFRDRFTVKIPLIAMSKSTWSPFIFPPCARLTHSKSDSTSPTYVFSCCTLRSRWNLDFGSNSCRKRFAFLKRSLLTDSGDYMSGSLISALDLRHFIHLSHHIFEFLMLDLSDELPLLHLVGM